MREFINESGLEFTDISSESFREYHFSNGRLLKIFKPLFLHVSKSGGHRVFDDDGISYYIQPSEGWFITWQVDPGKPNFVK
jgi:hypothetical protein